MRGAKVCRDVFDLALTKAKRNLNTDVNVKMKEDPLPNQRVFCRFLKGANQATRKTFSKLFESGSIFYLK